MRRLLAIACVFIAATIARGEEAYPVRPITLVVPYPPGGVTDTLARVLAERMRTTLGQSIVIENVPGAGGSIGIGRVARARPDGYTIDLGFPGGHVLNGALYALSYDAMNDFEPVAPLVATPYVIYARKTLPANDLRELIAWLRANPDKATAANVTVGVHLVTVFFQRETGTRFALVPYRGTAPAMQDLIAGRIDYQCPVITTAVPQIEGGTVKGIATLTKNRTPILPDLATAQEQGLKDFEAYIWFAIFLPKDTPPDIAQKLQHAIAAAENLPAVQERLKEISAAPIAPERQTPEYLAAFVEREAAKWAAPIRATGVGLD